MISEPCLYCAIKQVTSEEINSKNQLKNVKHYLTFRDFIISFRQN